jgi:hypothetical protein
MEDIDLELTDILKQINDAKKSQKSLDLSTTIDYANRLMAESIVELDKFQQFNNKAAFKRAKSHIVKLEWLFSELKSIKVT